jgi:hypothetical protein
MFIAATNRCRFPRGTSERGGSPTLPLKPSMLTQFWVTFESTVSRSLQVKKRFCSLSG